MVDPKWAKRTGEDGLLRCDQRPQDFPKKEAPPPNYKGIDKGHSRENPLCTCYHGRFAHDYVLDEDCCAPVIQSQYVAVPDNDQIVENGNVAAWKSNVQGSEEGNDVYDELREFYKTNQTNMTEGEGIDAGPILGGKVRYNELLLRAEWAPALPGGGEGPWRGMPHPLLGM